VTVVDVQRPIERVDLFDDRECASGDSRGGLDGEFHAEVVETVPPSAWTCVQAPACWHEIALAGVKRGQWPPPAIAPRGRPLRNDQAATVGPTGCASNTCNLTSHARNPSEDCVGSCVDGLNARWRGRQIQPRFEPASAVYGRPSQRGSLDS
jgi:hypothetical protein